MEGLLPIFVILFAGVVLERLLPGRRYPAMRRWRLKGALYFALYLVLSLVAPALWDGLLGRHRLIDATGLGTLWGGLLGFLLLDFVIFAWHWGLHRSDFLFRRLHQTHHSAERVDLASAFVFHPLDMIMFLFAGSFALTFVLGVTPEAAGWANLGSFSLAAFQHLNVPTPRWLGYLILRPENHALHHQRGVHAGNYGGIALWDMLFGTFCNPARYDGPVGYYDGASERTWDLLRGVDVTTPPSAEGRDGRLTYTRPSRPAV